MTVEQLREWCSFVCFGAVGCCAAQLLVSKKGVGRLFHLLTTTAFICCLMIPLLNMRADLGLQTDFLPQELVEGELEKRVTEQLSRQVEQTVTRLADECLTERGASVEKIVVQTDISADGCIHIEQVVLVVDKQNMSVALVVRDVLKQQLDTTVTVKTE